MEGARGNPRNRPRRARVRAHTRARRGVASGTTQPSRRIDVVSDAIRTPEECFADLPDFPFPARYREVDGLRLAHLDEGEGAPVLFVHGEPTWSYLWRKVLPPVRDAGFRCIAPDLVGFG